MRMLTLFYIPPQGENEPGTPFCCKGGFLMSFSGHPLETFCLAMAKKNPFTKLDSQLQIKRLRTLLSICPIHHGHPDLMPSCQTMDALGSLALAQNTDEESGLSQTRKPGWLHQC